MFESKSPNSNTKYDTNYDEESICLEGDEDNNSSDTSDVSGKEDTYKISPYDQQRAHCIQRNTRRLQELLLSTPIITTTGSNKSN